MQFFDTHAHIGLIYDDSIEQLRVVQDAKQANVTRIVSICNSLHDFSTVYDTLKTVSGVYHAGGRNGFCGAAYAAGSAPARGVYGRSGAAAFADGGASPPQKARRQGCPGRQGIKTGAEFAPSTPGAALGRRSALIFVEKFWIIIAIRIFMRYTN